jgi:hypothetical protein
MKKLIFVPLELMEERYSLQWYQWFEREIKERKLDCITILPNKDILTIQEGQFLDVIKTNKFKAQQLQEICQLFEQKIIDQDTVFLFMDAWFPGLEMLGYMRDALKIPFKMVGLFHAGTWDRNDFLFQCGMRDWGKSVEMSWFKLLDAMCVATSYHKDLIVERLDLHSMNYAEINKIKDKIYVTGFPIYPEFTCQYLENTNYPKLNRVVFPHRLAPEKQPGLFDKLSLLHKTTPSDPLTASYSFMKTKEFSLTKDEYYKNLCYSKISVSFALQETFGIAMLESVLCGCLPLVPDRLSYSELYPAEFKYVSTDNADVEVAYAYAALQRLIRGEQMYTMLLNPLQQKIINLGMNAIPNILNTCEALNDNRI